MALWSLLSLFTAAAAPSWSIVVTRSIGMDAEVGLQASETLCAVMDGMKSANLGTPIRPRPFAVDLKSRGVDPSVCAASVECASRLGEVGGVRFVVSLSLARVGPKLVVDATLVDVRAKAEIAQLTQTMPYADPQLGLGALARQLVERVPALPPEPEPAAVVPVVSAPPQLIEPPPPPPPEPSSGAKLAVPIAAGAAALIAGSFGVHFALQATGAARQISLLTTTPGSTFGPEQQQLDRWGKEAQTFATVSFAIAGAAVVALAVALILW